MFNQRSLSRFATADRGRNSVRASGYSTPDTASIVLAAGYFDGAKGLRAGDLIFCSVEVGGIARSLDLSVVSVSPIGAIVVANQSGPPAGFTYLADADGALLTDPDGAYLMEAA